MRNVLAKAKPASLCSGAAAQLLSGDAGRAEQSSHQPAPGIISPPSSPHTASTGHNLQQVSPWNFLWNLVIFVFIASVPCQALITHILPLSPLASQIIRKSEIPGMPFKGALHRVLHHGGFLPLPTQTLLHPQRAFTSLSWNLRHTPCSLPLLSMLLNP